MSAGPPPTITMPIAAEAARRHAFENDVQSWLLLGAMAGVLAVSAGIIWGLLGAVLSVVVVGLIYLAAPRVSPRVIMRMYEARAVEIRGGGQLTAIVNELARRAGLPTVPALYVVPSSTLNAFATGTRDDAVIAITEGLLRKLDLREVVGVLAHEVAHIRNDDLKVLGLADLIGRFTLSLSYVALLLAGVNIALLIMGEDPMSWWGIALLYLAPAISSLLQLALSRTREYDADLDAALLSGSADGLISALRRLERHTGHIWDDLMLPVPVRRAPQPSLLRTHPETSDRIARLLALKPPAGVAPIDVVAEPMISMVGLGPIEMRPRIRRYLVWY